MGFQRSDGRAPDALRPMTIVTGVNPYAEGSATIRCGRTTVLVTVSVEREIPPWMNPESGGWMTAEYGMLPRATHTRNKREAASGKQSGRTLEIQRLIGRALRAAVDLRALRGVTLRFDCDVLCADGGTRTAAITAGWVALAKALEWMRREGLAGSEVQLRQVAAISAGMLQGELLIDLNYEEDSKADFDLNLVLASASHIIEVQGTAERAAMGLDELYRLLQRMAAPLEQIMSLQLRAAGGEVGQEWTL